MEIEREPQSASVKMRWSFAGIGALAGVAAWGLTQALAQNSISELSAAVIGIILLSGFASFFALASYLSLGQAALRAVPHALALAGLWWLYQLRWSDIAGSFTEPGGAMALIILGYLPVPFMLAQAMRGSWRDYPALFHFGWDILVRGAVAVMFTAIVWALIGLSSLLLEVVGLSIIEDIISLPGVWMMISGATFGLAVAVVQDSVSDHFSPQLLVWLLRLLLPAVTLVSVVFIAAALLRGFDLGFRGLSPATTLLAMAAAGITLITLAIDAQDSNASKSPVILWSARLMAFLVVALALLALWAVGLRLLAEGLAPNRILVLLCALFALGYGLAYSLAVLWRRAWQHRIRQANVWLAVASLAVAALWLTPILNAERISAQDQKQLYLTGEKAPETLSRYAFRRLGIAGEAALAELEAQAQLRGDAALLAVLQGETAPVDEAHLLAQREALLTELQSILPVQPATATGTRLALLSLTSDWELEQIANACRRPRADNLRNCAMVVADLLPDLPGEEAALLLAFDGYFEAFGLAADGPEGRVRFGLVRADQRPLDDADYRGLLRDWQAAPPPLTPLRLNQLGTGGAGVYLRQ